MKSYGEICPVARALDVIGDRWSLLIVRELTLGPRRYGDLVEGLPGIPTNLLATRLKELQTGGVLVRTVLPPPVASTVYELTEAGRELQPVITALGRWGRSHGRPAASDDAVRPGWALRNAAGAPAAPLAERVCELRVDGDAFQLSAEDGKLTVAGGPASSHDAVITLSTDSLLALVRGQASAAATARQSSIEGDRQLARAALTALTNRLS